MSTTLQNSVSKVSKLAQNIIGSEIIKLAGEVNEKIKQGEKISFTYDSAVPNGGVPDIYAVLVVNNDSTAALELGGFEGTASIIFLYN